MRTNTNVDSLDGPCAALKRVTTTMLLLFAAMLMSISGMAIDFNENEHAGADCMNYLMEVGNALPQQGTSEVSEGEGCTTVVTPAEMQQHRERYGDAFRAFYESRRADIEQGRMPLQFVPVQVHIIRSDAGTGGVSEAEVLAEFEDYVRPYYVSSGLDFSFCAATNYIDDSDLLSITKPEGDAMSIANNVPDVLNIYYVDQAGSGCGYARFTFSSTDYIAITAGCHDNKSTVAHEIGHYFDLFHTHETANGAELVTRGGGANCATAGDGFCDTEAEPGTSISGLVTGAPACSYTGAATDANGDTYIANPTNLMSYAPKACRTDFTAEQVAMVIFTRDNGRSYLNYNCLPCDVTVTDCPSDISQDSDAGECGAIVNFTGPTFETSGACDALVVTSSHNSGDFFPVGTTQVSFIGSASGATAACFFDVTVSDAEAPVITCPADITIDNDASECGAEVNFDFPTATDNCGLVETTFLETVFNQTTSFDGNMFDIQNTSSSALTIDKFDVNFSNTVGGGVSSCSPAAIGSSHIGEVYYVTGGGSYVGNEASSGAWTLLGSASVTNAGNNLPSELNVGGLTLQPGETFGLYVTFTGGTCIAYTTGAGVYSDANLQLTMGQGIQYPFSSSTTTGRTWNGRIHYSTASGGAGAIVQQTGGILSGGHYPVGTTTNDFVATDAAGNTAICSFDVTVEDAEAPVALTCPAGVELSFNLNCTTNAPLVPDYRSLASFLDNCGVSSISQSPAPGSMLSAAVSPFVDGATFSVSLTATDDAGNTAIPCDFDVTLNDAVGPHIACPGDQEVLASQNGDGSCNFSIPDFTGDAAAGVLCGNELATVTQAVTAGPYTAGGTATVTLTADDGNGNTESCSFTISFVDDVAPMLVSCGPDPALATSAPGECEVSVPLTAPTVSDNCTAVTVWGVRSDGGADLTLANGFTGIFTPCTTTVDWYSVDAYGNESGLLCSNTVEVREPLDALNQPSANCKDATVSINDDGVATVCVDQLDNGSFDNCTGPLTIQIIKSFNNIPLPGEVLSDCITYGCDDKGENEVCVFVTDCSGNVSQCTSIVTVEDKNAPIIKCPAEITIDCAVDLDGNPYPGIDTPFDAVTPIHTVTFNTWDPTSNQDAATGITGWPLAMDNCTGIVTYRDELIGYSIDPHECEHHDYEIDRWWLVTDTCSGKLDSCVQRINVRDLYDPVIDPNGITDHVLACDDSVGIAAALAPVPTASDNCWLDTFDLLEDNSGAPEVLDCIATGYGARIYRMWKATDACGRTDILEQTINLIDTVAPELSVSVGDSTFTGPGFYEITLSNDSTKCDRNTFFTVSSSDNCDEILLDNYGFIFAGIPVNLDFVLLNGTGSFNRVFEKGTTLIEVSVIDDCGNSNLILISLTMEDTEAPVLECNDAPETYFTSNADVITPEDPFDCEANILIVTPPFMDNCPQGNGFLQASIDSSAWFVIPSGGLFSSGDLAIGTHTIQFSLVDDAGNHSDTCTKVFTIVDDQDPILSCPLSQTRNVDADGTADCALSYVDGKMGGVFGPFSNIIPGIFDNCDYTAEYTLTGATSGTGSFTVGLGTAPGLTFDLNVGNTSIVYSVMDAAGNMTQCSFSVTVFDNIDPTMTCPGDILATTDPGVCTYTADVTPIVDDNCAVDRVEYVMSGASAGSGIIAFADLPDTLGAFAFAEGHTDVTYTVYDVWGNPYSCSYMVDITDSEIPVAHCPGDYVVGTSGTIYTNGETGAIIPVLPFTYSSIAPLGDCETTVAGLHVPITDNCCVASAQYRIIDLGDGTTFQNWIAVANSPQVVDDSMSVDLSAQVFPKGDYRVELRAWDCHMLEGVCSFEVEVFDDEKPAFTDCPSDQTLETTTTDCEQIVNWVEPKDENVVDNCLVECGVDPIVGPWVSFDGDRDEEDVDPGVNVTFQSSGDAFASFPVGDRWVKYYVEDEHGNREYCIFKVTVEDNIFPTVSNCPSLMELPFNLDCTQNAPGLPDYTGHPQYLDNCGIASIVQSPAPGTDISTLFGTPYVDGATTVVTITGTDIGGNTVSCSITVELNDGVGPHIACPGDQDVLASEHGDGACNIMLPDFTALASAGVLCGNEEATVTQSHTPIAPATAPYQAGDQVTVTLTASDASGNTEACSFIATFKDDVSPALVACGPDPALAYAPIGGCDAGVSLTAPTVSDNCDAAPIVWGVRSDGGANLTASNGYVGIFQPCSTTVDWYAEDADGNVSGILCSNTVEVREPLNEQNQPNAICTDRTISINDAGVATICPDLLSVGSNDNCPGPLTITIVKSINSIPIPGEPFTQGCITYGCEDKGENEVCVFVEDCSGNVSQCTAIVTVEDKNAPIIKCPEDITIDCAVDNDANPYPGIDTPFDAVVPVDYVVFNNWDKTSTQDAAAGITGYPLAMDNCTGIVTYRDELVGYSIDEHECEHHDYEINRWWLVTDTCSGKLDSCLQVIQVRDLYAPEIDPNGVADAILACDDDAGIAAALAPSPTASDNCYLASLELVFDNSGAPEELNCLATGYKSRITRRWVATDACGNSSDLIQIINLYDNVAPDLSVTVGGQTFTTDGAVTIATDAGKCDADVLFELVSSDNCDDQLADSYTLDINNGGGPLTVAYSLNGTDYFSRVLEKGVNPVSVTVTDDCGNSTTINIDVTIADMEAPELTCNAVQETYFTSSADVISDIDANGDCQAVILVVTPAFQDNCPQEGGYLQVSLDGGAFGPIPSGGLFAIGPLSHGAHTVEFNLVDGSGNHSDTCLVDIEIIDDEDPELICPSSKILTVSQDGVNDCVASYTQGWLGNIHSDLTSIVPSIFDNCGYTAEYTLTGATSGTGSFSVTPAAGPFDPAYGTGLDIDFNVGNTSVNYTAMDADGNMVQCSFSVTVLDDIDPTITCPSDIVANTDPAECNYTADVSPVVADNCEVDRVEYVMSGATGASGTIAYADLSAELAAYDFEVGTTYVTYTVYDLQGNSAACSYTVTITDVENPIMTCPSDVAIGTSADGTGDCTTAVAGLYAEATDNCCVSSIQYKLEGVTTQDWTHVPGTQPPGSVLGVDLSGLVFEKGITTVTVAAWDCYMNGDTCSFTVTVSDDEEPFIEDCPADITVNTLSGNNNCFNNVIWEEPTIDDVTDNCLPDCPVSIDGPHVSYDADADLDDIDATILAISQSNGNAFGTFPVGTRYVKYKATDDAGNTSFCIFAVEVVDDQAPTIDCPADFTLSFNLDCDTVTLQDYTGGALVQDNCGIDTIIQTPAPGTLISDIPGITPNIGESFVVTLLARDYSGLEESCTFIVTVDDFAGPTISCPAPQTIYTGLGNTDCMVAIPDYRDNATATVACGDELTTVFQSPAPGDMISGVTTVTMIALDSQNQSAACTFDVTVVDNTAPEGVCAADPAPATAAIGGCDASVTLTAPSVTDNCAGTVSVKGLRSDGGADILTTSGASVTETFATYTSTVTWIATDAAGNSAELCTNTIVVAEPLNEANEPTAACGDLTLGLKNDGQVELCAGTLGFFSTDNCVDPSELTLLLHIEGSGVEPSECITFDCSDIGTFEICLIARDPSGNEDRCYSYLTIQDKRDPFIKCPADIDIACHNDNGGNPNPGVAVPFAAISPFSQVAFDAWSPSADSGQDAESGITGAPLAMDNCGGTVTYSDNSGQVADITDCRHYTYDIIRTWRVDDNYGQYAECEQVIHVKDTIAPWFTESVYYLDRFIDCDDPNLAAELAAALSLEPTENDLCYVTKELISDVTSDPYSTCISYLGQSNVWKQRTRTWRASDACGNTTDYVQTISYQDFAAPALVCPNDGNTIDVVVDAGVCSVNVDLVATATDCQDVTFSYVVKDLNSGSMTQAVFSADATQDFGPGNYCIEFTAMDPCGNSTSCQTFVNVSDDQNPTVDCGSLTDIALATDLGFCDVYYPWTSPTINDNCPGATLYCELSGATGDGTPIAVPSGVGIYAFFNLGVTNILYYAEDAYGNLSDSCGFSVTVTDEDGPYETGPNYCPSDVALGTSVDGIDNYDCSAPFNWKSPDLTDDCGLDMYTCMITNGADTLSGPSATTSSDSHTFDFPVGTSTVSYVASDASGNTWTCSFDVTVSDDENPVAVCQDIIVDLDAEGYGHVAANDGDVAPYTIDGGSYDNCGVSWSVSDSLFDCTDLGAHTVTLTASDAAGNSYTCDALVVVRDLELPTITCPADAAVTTAGDGEMGDCDYVTNGTEFDPEIDDNTADICGLTLVNDYNGGSSLADARFSADGSPYLITWTVTDIAGNTAQCTQMITVTDDESPAFTYCPADVELDALTGNCHAQYAWVEPTLDDVTDNCGILRLGQYGNDGPFLQDGTVFPIEQSNGQAFADFPVGETVLLYTVWDTHGNVSTCEFTVTVNDTEAPVIASIVDSYDEPFDGEYCGALVDVLPPQAYDLCGAVTFTNDYNGTADGLDVYPAGKTTVVTWTVTDEAGNTAIATTSVEVGRIGPASNLVAVCRPDKNFIKLKFDPAEGAQRYLVQVRAEGGTDFLWVDRNYNANVNVSYLPMDTLPDGNYQWRVVSLCKMDDAPNLPGWQEYTKRYTAWKPLILPCTVNPIINGDDDEEMAAATKGISVLGGASALIYPNPSEGLFNIRTDLTDYTLEIMDIEGKLVYAKSNIQEQLIEVDVKDLANGVYMVKMYGANSVITERVTIQR